MSVYGLPKWMTKVVDQAYDTALAREGYLAAGCPLKIIEEAERCEEQLARTTGVAFDAGRLRRRIVAAWNGLPWMETVP